MDCGYAHLAFRTGDGQAHVYASLGPRLRVTCVMSRRFTPSVPTTVASWEMAPPTTPRSQCLGQIFVLVWHSLAWFSRERMELELSMSAWLTGVLWACFVFFVGLGQSTASCYGLRLCSRLCRQCFQLLQVDMKLLPWLGTF